MLSARPAPAPSAPIHVPGRVLRVGGGLSVRVRPRPIGLALLLAILTFALLVLAVGTGDFPISPGDVVSALFGAGDGGTTFVVRELRLPRAICAVLVGVALGISGAVFQSLTRNPLGSPDIVGFQQGAAVGALVVITVIGGSGAAISAGALVGGGVSALLVYLLAFKRGSGVTGYRLVLIGIAVAALGVALIDYLLSRARIQEGQEATRWLLGSLNGRSWDDVVPLMIALAILLPGALFASRPLRVLELGDDAAHALGLGVERARFGLIALAVGLVSVTTVAVGPIVFVALIAPQIARRLARTAEPALGCAALTGAVLVLGADVAAQRLVPDTPLPVGVMTGSIGGLYLAFLLTRGWRHGRA